MDSTFDSGHRPFDAGASGSGASGRKATIFGIIVVFHVLLVIGLNSSLSTIFTERPPKAIIAELMEEIETEDEPPPPPPTIETPPPYVPPPDIVIDLPMDVPATTALTQVTNVPKPAAPAPPPAAGIKVAPKVDKRFERRLRPDYPPTSRRLNEEGLVIVDCFINLEGKCQEVKLKTSSGFPRLDEAVLKHAPRAWRFTPGSEDGKPTPMWVTVPMRFKITDG